METEERVVIPGFYISKTQHPVPNEEPTKILSVDLNFYEKTPLPTLRQLVHAQWGTPDGKRPEYLQRPTDGKLYTLSKLALDESVIIFGESYPTTTFINGNELIENPKTIRSYNYGSETRFTGGERTYIEIPEAGWVINFDPETGFPSETSDSDNIIVGQDCYPVYRTSNAPEFIQEMDIKDVLETPMALAMGHFTLILTEHVKIRQWL